MTGTPRLTEDELRQFVRFTHTRHWPMLQRFPISDDLHDELLAQMVACPPETVRAIAGAMAAQTRATAEEMLGGHRYRDALRALPFRAEDRVVAVGDSLTADRLGWFELLSASAALAGPPPATMINLGVSGNTTADVIERFDALEAARPSHVLLMLGTNDARSHGRPAGHHMATTAETERNLRALLDLTVNGLGAAATVIGPPAVDQPRVDAFFAGAVLRWDAGAVAEIAEIARKVDPTGIDLHGVTRSFAADGDLEPDGVHPTPAGQRRILTHIVGHLAGEPGGCERSRA
jgi:acyl-CoA thioesterase I